MGLTNFSNGLSSFGVPVIGGNMIPFGKDSKVFFVDQLNGSDGNRGDQPNRALATLSKAHSLMTSNRNDVAVVIGSVTGTNGNITSTYGSSIAVREAATLAWSKNQCHILGISYNRIAHRVSIRAASGVDFTPLVNVTGDGCVFANLHAFQGYATNEAQVCWNDAGERNAYYNCHIAGMGAQLAADHASSRSLTITGTGLGENYFKDCVIGVDTVDRGAANSQLVISGGSARNIFENCTFLSRADASTPLFVSIGASGIDRFVDFVDCMFHNHGTTLTTAMSINASPGGSVIIRGARSILVGATEYDSADVAVTNLPAAVGGGGQATTVNND